MMETQRYIELAREFCMFGIIGAIGFVVNIASVYIFRDAIGLYLAGSAAWFVAATVTWFLNRNWTFNRRGRTSMLRQWISFLLANSFGFILYYAAYVGLIAYSPFFAGQPFIAVFFGTIAGMFANFTLSRWLVFR